DFHVTGVQTCALPISQIFVDCLGLGGRFDDDDGHDCLFRSSTSHGRGTWAPRPRIVNGACCGACCSPGGNELSSAGAATGMTARSEEGRVGKEDDARV